MALSFRSPPVRYGRESPPVLPPYSRFSRSWSFLTILCCSQSKTVYSLAISALYHTVELNEADQCCTTLDMLYKHPGIARHVQKLVVRHSQGPQPRNLAPSTLRGFSYAVPSHVCAAVKRAAAKLDALQCFIWGGEDYPSEDDMWFVLRQSYVPFPRSFRARAD